jgi:hypothetical protein
LSDPISDLKRELLAAAERRHSHATARDGHGWLRAGSARARFLVAATTLSIVAAVALLFTSPWSRSPTFLARAEAALTPPEGTILHQRWELTWTSKDPACTGTSGPNEAWIDETPPHRYRAFVREPRPDPSGDRPVVCWPTGPPVELGGTFDSDQNLRFEPPNSLSVSGDFILNVDPFGDLRDQIAAGTAHDEGETQLHGRTVERIRLDTTPVSYVWVDPETFYPVENEFEGVMGPFVVRMVWRNLTFEFLPRTDANLALTNIEAQHPNATIRR